MRLAWLCYRFEAEDEEDLEEPVIKFVEPERWLYAKVIPIVFAEIIKP